MDKTKPKTKFVPLILQLLVFAIVVKNVASDPKVMVSNKSLFDFKSGDKLETDKGEHGRFKRADVSKIKGMYNEARISPYTKEEEKAILDKHLEFRSQVDPEASNMEYMTWNEYLAELAGLWASVCYWGHGLTDHTDLINSFESGIGQNLWLGGGKPNGVGAVVSWHDNEKNNYIYEDGSCKPNRVCGHYTQVVWAKSKEVGCARAFCANTIDLDGNPDSKTNVWIFACHYAPPGNSVGVKPFKSGPSCTECQSGIGHCTDNACKPCDARDDSCDCRQICHNCGTLSSIGACKCTCIPGWYGASCSTKCEDTHKNCWANPGWPGPQFCSSHEAVPRGCPIMCGVCEPGDGMCDTTTIKPMTMSSPAGFQTTNRPTKGNLCEGKMCENGGTLQTKGCKCQCRDENTGETCAKSKNQVKKGVEMLMEADIDLYTNTYEVKLRKSVAELVTKYCNKNVKQCCGGNPDRSDQQEKRTFSFLSNGDVMTARGYPETHPTRNDAFWTMVIVRVPEKSLLCGNGTHPPERRKREMTRVLDRIRREHEDEHNEVFLDQDILLSVISENTQVISDAVGVTIKETRRGGVAENSSGGIKPGGVAGVVIFVLLIIIAIVIVVVVLLKRKETDKKAGSSKEENVYTNHQVQDKKPDQVKA